jgi:hypothetical protein
VICGGERQQPVYAQWRLVEPKNWRMVIGEESPSFPRTACPRDGGDGNPGTTVAVYHWIPVGAGMTAVNQVPLNPGRVWTTATANRIPGAPRVRSAADASVVAGFSAHSFSQPRVCIDPCRGSPGYTRIQIALSRSGADVIQGCVRKYFLNHGERR